MTKTEESGQNEDLVKAAADPYSVLGVAETAVMSLSSAYILAVYYCPHKGHLFHLFALYAYFVFPAFCLASSMLTPCFLFHMARFRMKSRAHTGNFRGKEGGL
jgi:hypothetical protein